MAKLYRSLGKLCFWICWPALYVYLPRTRRTRILVRCGDYILVTKTWLGDGRWSLSGGGLHAGEDAVAGAQRELLEETAISVDTPSLHLLFEQTYHAHKLRFNAVFYSVELTVQPDVRTQRFEISDYTWVHYRDISVADYTPDVQIAVAEIFRKT